MARPQKAWEGRPHHKKWGILYFYIDEVCCTFPFNRTRIKYRRRSERCDGVLLRMRRYQRRRERADGVLLLRRGPLDEVYDALYFIISRTQKRYQRRRRSTDGVLLLRRGLLMKVYDVLYFIISRTRRRYQRLREKADGVLLPSR